MTLPPENHRLQPDRAPTPFSAAQIRSGCPAGRTIRVRSERRDEPTTYRVIRFVDVDDDGALQVEEWIGDAQVGRTVVIANSSNGA